MHNTTECHNYKTDRTPTHPEFQEVLCASSCPHGKLRNLSRKLPKRVRIATVMRKVTVATPIILKVMGIVVPEKIVIVVRNLN